MEAPEQQLSIGVPQHLGQHQADGTARAAEAEGLGECLPIVGLVRTILT